MLPGQVHHQEWPGHPRRVGLCPLLSHLADAPQILDEQIDGRYQLCAWPYADGGGNAECDGETKLRPPPPGLLVRREGGYLPRTPGLPDAILEPQRWNKEARGSPLQDFLPDWGEQGEEGRRDGNAGGQSPARSALPAWTTRGQRRTALPPREQEARPQQRPVRGRGSVGQVQPQV